jgi:hypothetical protein
MKFNSLLKSWVLLLAPMLLAGCANFQSKDAALLPKPLPKVTEVKSILWVGNSFFYYNNSMHGHVSQLLSAAGEKGHRSSSATISGSGINWHDVEAHFKPDAVGSYSFVGDNEVKFNTFDRPFDATMMMDCSQCPIHPKLQSIFYEFAKKHSDTVRKHGSEPVLFMSWAYADKPEMTEPLAMEYIKAGKLNNALVVPAGYAFANSIAKRPDVSLIINDKRHPTLAGTYLGASTVLASVYKINPIGSKYTAGLPADVAKHLQTIAWETSQQFHAKEGRGSLP